MVRCHRVSKDDEVLLIDSLHGLYEDMSSSIPASHKFKTHIETLGQVRTESGVFMRWADMRLMRRMIRDSWHRNLQSLETLTHWYYVRASELRNIIPFIKSVDYVVNSALPFELPILRHHLYDYFPTAISTYKDEPKRQDACIRAKRVKELLDGMIAIADDNAIGGNSLNRKFIGGSDYAY